MSVKCLSGFCTSAKTHSLHNLQSMRTKVQAPFLFIYFFSECDLLNLSSAPFFQSSLHWHTHTGKLNNLTYTKKKGDKAQVEKKGALKWDKQMLLMDICQSGALIICQGRAAAPNASAVLCCHPAAQSCTAPRAHSPDNKVSLSFTSITKNNFTLEYRKDYHHCTLNQSELMCLVAAMISLLNVCVESKDKTSRMCADCVTLCRTSRTRDHVTVRVPVRSCVHQSWLDFCLMNLRHR